VVSAAFIDAHCHLDQCADPIGAARAASQAGVVVVAVTETPARYLAVARLFAGRSNVRVALGLHPLRAIRASRRDVTSFIGLLPSVDYVGEVGLDYSREGKPSQAAQIRVLDEILAAPGVEQKVWSLHSRRAEADVIARLESRPVTGVLHWYTGPTALIDRACAAGAYFSVNLAMLGSASGRRVIEALPRDRVLTETDAPFAKGAGATGLPTDVASVVRVLARTWGLGGDEAQAMVFNNMAAVFARAKHSESDHSAG
jgi:TatD DNase family protein